jgi:hypothetical protein
LRFWRFFQNQREPPVLHFSRNQQKNWWFRVGSLTQFWEQQFRVEAGFWEPLVKGQNQFFKSWELARTGYTYINNTIPKTGWDMRPWILVRSSIMTKSKQRASRLRVNLDYVLRIRSWKTLTLWNPSMCTHIEHRIGTGHALNIQRGMGTYGFISYSQMCTLWNLHVLLYWP